MISIIIPAFNAENYIDRCIRSVVRQTYKDIEIIVIDDGSTDKTLEKCKEWMEYDKRIRVLSQKNQGQGIARNYGIDVSRGEYLAFVDADDWLDEKALEKAYCVMAGSDADVVLFDFYCVQRTSDNKFEKIESYNPCTYNKPFTMTDDYSLFYKLTGVLWDALWKKSCFTGIRMSPHAYEDEKIVMSILASGVKIVQLKEQLYYYVLREDSTTHNPKSIEGLETTFLWLRDSFKDREDYGIIYDMLRIRVLFCYRLLLIRIYSVDKESVKEYEQRAIAYLNREFPLRELKIESKCLLLGSYNLRLIAKRAFSIVNEQIEDFALSSMISAMDSTKITWDMPEVSPYTKHMYQKDWNGNLKSYLKELDEKEYQYVIIDFLEEIRNVFCFQNHYVTEFQEMKQLGIETEGTVAFGTEEFMTLWKTAIDELILNLKKKFKANQVILVCNYCNCEKLKMGDLQYAKHTSDEQYKILMQPDFELFVMRKRISEMLYSSKESMVDGYFDRQPQWLRYNNQLKDMYQYFIEQYQGINVVCVQEEYAGTDIYFPLGAEPYYANEAYYLQAADLVKSICSK